MDTIVVSSYFSITALMSSQRTGMGDCLLTLPSSTATSVLRRLSTKICRSFSRSSNLKIDSSRNACGHCQRRESKYGTRHGSPTILRDYPPMICKTGGVFGLETCLVTDRTSSSRRTARRKKEYGDGVSTTGQSVHHGCHYGMPDGSASICEARATAGSPFPSLLWAMTLLTAGVLGQPGNIPTFYTCSQQPKIRSC